VTKIVAAAFNRLFDLQQIKIELLEEIGRKRATFRWFLTK